MNFCLLDHSFQSMFFFFFTSQMFTFKFDVRDIDKRGNRDYIESHKSKMISGTWWMSDYKINV